MKNKKILWLVLVLIVALVFGLVVFGGGGDSEDMEGRLKGSAVKKVKSVGANIEAEISYNQYQWRDLTPQQKRSRYQMAYNDVVQFTNGIDGIIGLVSKDARKVKDAKSRKMILSKAASAETALDKMLARINKPSDFGESIDGLDDAVDNLNDIVPEFYEELAFDPTNLFFDFEAFMENLESVMSDIIASGFVDAWIFDDVASIQFGYGTVNLYDDDDNLIATATTALAPAEGGGFDTVIGDELTCGTHDECEEGVTYTRDENGHWSPDDTVGFCSGCPGWGGGMVEPISSNVYYSMQDAGVEPLDVLDKIENAIDNINSMLNN